MSGLILMAVVVGLIVGVLVARFLPGRHGPLVDIAVAAVGAVLLCLVFSRWGGSSREVSLWSLATALLGALLLWTMYRAITAPTRRTV